jgi:hypothetical protein
MQPHQLGIACQIRNFHQVGYVVLAGKNPPNMAIHETHVPGRMHILAGVGVQMVMPVLGSPPQNAFLGATLGEERRGRMYPAPIAKMRNQYSAVQIAIACNVTPDQIAAMQPRCINTKGMADG